MGHNLPIFLVCPQIRFVRPRSAHQSSSSTFECCACFSSSVLDFAKEGGLLRGLVIDLAFVKNPPICRFSLARGGGFRSSLDIFHFSVGFATWPCCKALRTKFEKCACAHIAKRGTATAPPRLAGSYVSIASRFLLLHRCSRDVMTD